MSASLLRNLSEARARLNSGDLEGAQSLCRTVLESAPRNPEALCLLGITYLAGGDPVAALAPLKQCLAVAPRHGMALENLGLAHLMRGEFKEAEAVLAKAAALPGSPPSVRMRLGVALLSQGRSADAVRELQHALASDLQNADIHLNLARAYGDGGDVAAARRHLEQVLTLAPDHADALFNLGVLSLTEAQFEDARQWFERALTHAPNHAEALINLGMVHEAEHRPREALTYFERAVESDPRVIHAHEALARLLASEGRHEPARQGYLSALQLDPGNTAIRQALAASCRSLGRFKEGAELLREVVRLDVKNVAASHLLADILFELGQIDEALALTQDIIARDASYAGAYLLAADIYNVQGELELAAAALKTGYSNTQAPFLLGKLTYALRRLCDWQNWRTTWLRLDALLTEHPGAATPFSLLCEPVSPARQLTHATAWSAAEYAAYASFDPPQRQPASGKDRIRIGYFSSDFYEHATAYLLAEVLELHDRERFEMFAYSYGPDDHSPMRERLFEACEHFVDVARESDDVIAHRIRNDGIDILIDLKGFTMGARTGVMARRPCEIQVSWVGYPGTMGAPFIDCLIADPSIIPPELEAAYSERILRLPDCYQPNDRRRQAAQALPRNAYGLPDDAFVFCCFNQAYKITPDVFASWMRLLASSPRSVLWLLEDNRWAADNLKREATRFNIAAERLIFAPRVPLDQHLARYASADLALDTFPYGSHTTASDALWSGCPLVAFCGETFASRVSGSIIKAGGLSELIAYDIGEYERIAGQIANDRNYAQSLRTRLAHVRESAPLFDSPAFTRELEKLYFNLASQSAR